MRVDHHSSPAIRRAAFYWHLLRHAYRYANTVTHRVLGIVVRLTILAYFLFGIAFLYVRYEVMPNIDHYKPTVERLASKAIGQPVRIRNIYASWRGFHPYVFLGGVSIYDNKGKEALSLPGLSATFSWLSALRSDVHLRSLEISRPDLVIERAADGKLTVAGIPINANKNGEGGKGLDWILSQDTILIREGSIHWKDGLRGAPQLDLNDIDFTMLNGWRRHKFALNAAPPPSSAAPLDIRADFTHSLFTGRASDATKWTGEFYLDMGDTDLAAWKAYFDYPVDISSGKGAVRAWLSFDHAKVADFTADLSLADVSTRLQKDLEPLNLTYVAGRISVQEKFSPYRMDGHLNFGQEGHVVSVAGLTMRTDDGMVLPPTTASETHVPAIDGRPESTEINVKLVDLDMLARFMERLPLPTSQRSLVADFAPRGQLRDFYAQWQGSYPQILSYEVKGRFSGLSLKAQQARTAHSGGAAVPAIPGFENLTGSIDANANGGTMMLDSYNTRLDLPSYFVDPVIALDQLQMTGSWTFPEKDKVQLNIARMSFSQDGFSGTLAGRHLLPLSPQKGGPLGIIDLSAHITTLDVSRIGPLLPARTPAGLREWLTSGMEDGRFKDVDVRLKGDLSQFPFRAQPGKRPQGEFTVNGRIENVRLNYAPGKFGDDGQMPLWPRLEDINGTIAIDRTRLEIEADRARTHGVVFSKVKASIADLLAPDILLAVEGSSKGPLQYMVGYTVDSPISEWIGRFTDDTKASGDAALDLKLALPLNRLANSKVQGSLHFSDNDVALMSAMPPLLSTQGRIDFDEHGFKLDGLRADFLGGGAVVAGGTQRDGNILIKASGNMTVTGLRRAYPAPAMQRLISRLSGATRYSASVDIRKKQSNIKIESSLQGIGLVFPAPLKKAAGDSLPLKIEIASAPADNSPFQHDEIKMSLGPSIAVRYLRKKINARGSLWQVASGGIGINAPPPQPDSGLIANISLDSLNLDEWNKVVSSITEAGSSEGASSAASGNVNVSQYIEPQAFAAHATSLILAGKKLDNVVVGASFQNGAWQANIDSAQASGYVTWGKAGAGQKMGNITARLSSLIIPESAASDVSDLLEGKNTASQIPGLFVIADDFQLFGKKLGRLELTAFNVPASTTREWRISELSLSNPDAELDASGKWSFNGGENVSSMEYSLDINNAGKLLDRLGFPNIMKNGKGKMSGNINWKGLPFAFDIPTLSGQIKMDVRSGQIMKVDLGGAKLLGVLSLQGLPRLNEVVADGLAFESIAATATISQGVAKTDSFKMRSVNMTVAIDGSIDIAKESQNLHATIIPDYNLGTGSLVYAAINPVVGVGTFLAQLFLREPLAKALTMEYKITGSWKEPVYTKIQRRSDAMKAPAQGSEANDKAS